IRATSESVFLYGHAQNSVNVGNAGSVQAINGPLTIENPTSGLATVNVDDSADSRARTVTLETLTGGDPYGYITGLAPAAILYNSADTPSETCRPGPGGAVPNVIPPGVQFTLLGHGPGTTVNVGNAGSVQAINGPLTISDPPASATVNVDDSADGTAQNVT